MHRELTDCPNSNANGRVTSPVSARWRRFKLAGIGVLVFVAVITLGLTIVAGFTRLPGEEVTPAGIRRSASRYVKMRDGVEIAVTVIVPADLKVGKRLPVLIRTTRYWREPQLGWAYRVLVGLHVLGLPDDDEDKQAAYFNQRHFVVLAVDARGSGASGGSRAVEWSPDEVADMGEVAAWAAQQPWSNGRIGTFGISYDGNAAELAAAAGQPAIRAVMPLYDNFDVLWAIQAGGVGQKDLLQEWGRVVAALDQNDVCGADETSGLNCWRDRLLTPGVQPVDRGASRKPLADAIKQHNNLNVNEAVAKIEFADDRLGPFRLPDISPSGLRAKIEASKVPMMVWCGWFDGGGGEDALTRYKNFSNPQLVVIGPFSHGGDFNVDPFASNHTPAEPPMAEQLKMEADFFDQTLRTDNPPPVQSSVRYYTMGEGQWHTTNTWPPEGLSERRLYFGADNTLTSEAPPPVSSTDSYTVDFTASTGKQSVWATGYGGGDVVYPDRANEDRKLLVYNSAPLSTDVEITGSPILTLELASTTTDGAVHAYLEDVSPDNRVTYVDEGILRLIDRREVDARSLPYVPLGPAHSFMRKDAQLLTPGQPTRIRLSLYPTSILLRKGHRIRLALAGADAGVFERYPPKQTPIWSVYRTKSRASFVDLPLTERRSLPPEDKQRLPRLP